MPIEQERTSLLLGSLLVLNQPSILCSLPDCSFSLYEPDKRGSLLNCLLSPYAMSQVIWSCFSIFRSQSMDSINCFRYSIVLSRPISQIIWSCFSIFRSQSMNSINCFRYSIVLSRPMSQIIWSCFSIFRSQSMDSVNCFRYSIVLSRPISPISWSRQYHVKPKCLNSMLKIV